MHQANLCRSLLVRQFHPSAEPDDLDTALDLPTRSVSTTPADDLARGTRLAALQKEATGIAKKVLRATPNGHPLHFLARELLDQTRAERRRH